MGDAESGESLKEKALTPLTAWEADPAERRLSEGSRISKKKASVPGHQKLAGGAARSRTVFLHWSNAGVCGKAPLSPTALTTIPRAVSCDEHQREFVWGTGLCPKAAAVGRHSCQAPSLGILLCSLRCCYPHAAPSHQSLASAAGRVWPCGLWARLV